MKKSKRGLRRTHYKSYPVAPKTTKELFVCKECYSEVGGEEAIVDGVKTYVVNIHRDSKGNKCKGSRRQGFEPASFWSTTAKGVEVQETKEVDNNEGESTKEGL